MIKEAINRIVELAQGAMEKPVDVDGRKYWLQGGGAIKPPTVSSVATVKTLDALISALEAPELLGLTKDCLGALQIVVKGPREVSIVSAPDNTWAQREHYIDAEWRGDTFPFDRFMDVETFIVKAQCSLDDSDTKQAMISHVSAIVGAETIENSDDGISQSVVVTDALNPLNRKGRAAFSPMLTLKPYRAFPEADQPESLFLLRMKKDGDKTPLVAIFEADGGLWVSKACANVAAYLRNDERVKKLGIAVIG
jgi:hypothetical protein